MHSVIIKDTGIPDEHLYGRAGYLAAVMFVQSHLGDDVIHTDIIRKVCVYEFAIASPQVIHLVHQECFFPSLFLLLLLWHMYFIFFVYLYIVSCHIYNRCYFL